MQLVSLECKVLIANDKLNHIIVRLNNIEQMMANITQILENIAETNKRARFSNDEDGEGEEEGKGEEGKGDNR